MRRIVMGISIVVLVLMSGCVPHDIASESDSYTLAEFTKISQNYGKALYTKSGKTIHFGKMNIARDTIYLADKEKKLSGKARKVPLSDVRMIGLAPRVSATFWGASTGVAVGVGTSVILASGSHSFGPAISFAIIPPVLGLAGGMIGHGIDRKSAYSGYYRIIPDGASYRLQSME